MTALSYCEDCKETVDIDTHEHLTAKDVFTKYTQIGFVENSVDNFGNARIRVALSDDFRSLDEGLQWAKRLEKFILENRPKD